MQDKKPQVARTTSKGKKQAAERRRRGFLSFIPSVGRTGTVIGVAGIFFGTLALSLIVAVLLRTVLAADALNPFAVDVGLPTAVPNATPNPEFLVPTLDLGNARPWQGNEPVTILLMGADTRPSERGSARPRSDTMMLLMADPVTKRASVLSIPRDLYVDVPGYGLNRINTAYAFGGGSLAVSTVQYNLGVRVNHFVLIEFEVFTTLVDEIGGIDVYVPYPINDPNYPDMSFGYDPLYIPAGWQHMDGDLALKYVRTRHSDSDFNRAQRQQDVMFAIRDKVLSLNMLPTLIQRSPNLYAALADNIYTDMTLEQMTSLALLVQDIPRENIRTGVINADYTTGYVTPEGAQVLIPQRDRIGQYLAYIFWLQ